MRNQPLADYVERLWKESGISSMRKVCEKADINPGALHAILKGKTNPSPYTIDRLVSIFGEQHRTPLMQLAGHLPTDVEPRQIQEEQVLYRIEQEIRALRSRMPVVLDVELPERLPMPGGEPWDVKARIELADVIDVRDPLAVEVGGACLEEAGIVPGDILVIDRWRKPRDGEVVLIVCEDGPALRFWPDVPEEYGTEVIGVAVKVLKDAPKRGE